MNDVRQACFSAECAGDDRLFVWDEFRQELKCATCRRYESAADQVNRPTGTTEPDPVDFPLWGESPYDERPDPKPLPETVEKHVTRVVGKARRRRAEKKARLVVRVTGHL